MLWDIWSIMKIPKILNWVGQSENLPADTVTHLKTEKEEVNF